MAFSHRKLALENTLVNRLVRGGETLNTYVKACLIVMLIGVCVFAGFAGAAVYYQLNYPSSAEGQTVEVTAYLDSILWKNNTEIDWGPVNATTAYWSYLNVTNSGQLACTVTLHSQGLPNGWTQTWTANNTVIAPTEWANGTLTVTTTTVEAITYEWDTIIRAEQT